MYIYICIYKLIKHTYIYIHIKYIYIYIYIYILSYQNYPKFTILLKVKVSRHKWRFSSDTKLSHSFTNDPVGLFYN